MGKKTSRTCELNDNYKESGLIHPFNKIQEKIGQTYDLKGAKMQCNTQYNAIHAM